MRFKSNALAYNCRHGETKDKMKLASATQMRKIEDEAVKRQGIALKELMASAGQAVAALAAKLIPAQGQIAIFCGHGNNGGDGFIAARHLALNGYQVTVVLASDADDLKGIAAEAYDSLTKSSARIVKFNSGLCLRPGLVIDALLGFGLKGEVRKPIREIIAYINSLKAETIAIDVPSGVNSDTGEVANIAIKAAHTVTFTCPKIGLALYPGAEYVGRIHPVDIGIAPEIVEEFATTNLATEEMIKSLLPRRERETNKHRCGRLLIVAGSAGMTGAAAMTAMAALRMGAGIVTLAVPAGLNDILEVKLTEVMTVPLPETKERSIAAAAVDKVLKLLRNFDALAIGPGLSRNRETAQFVRELMTQTTVPAVIDADALNNLAGTDIVSGRQAPTVLTPHSGELGRLMDMASADIEVDRIGIAEKAGAEFNATIVLKGSRTIISGHKATMINPSGNPGLATAGTGDVLTGIISSLLAQGLADYPAAVAGSYLHGLAGDIAAAAKGELALIATDLIDCLPKAIKKVMGDKN